VATSRLCPIFKDLAQARDLTLLVLTCTYALGFLIWSVYAWRQGMGLLPIANTQYFIAGLPIMLALVGTYLLVHCAYWLQSWASSDVPKRRRIVYWLTVAAVVPWGSLEFFGDIPRTTWSPLAWEAFVIVKALVGMVFFTLLLIDSTLDHGASRAGALSWFLTLGVSLAVALLLLLWVWISFVDEVLPLWPQELGGFRPRRPPHESKRPFPGSSLYSSA